MTHSGVPVMPDDNFFGFQKSSRQIIDIIKALSIFGYRIKMHQRLARSLHALAVAHNVFAIIYSNQPKDFSQVTDPRILDMQNFALVYFTGWNITIQTVYFALAIACDILDQIDGQDRNRKKLMALQGYIFTAFVFPCSLFVSLMFWSVYTIDRELVLPEVLDPYVPQWLNHSFHTNIIIFVFLELLLNKQQLPTFKSALIGLTLLSAVYDLVFFFAYYETNRWIYGLYYILSWPERIILTILNYFLAVLGLKIGIYLQEKKERLL